MLTQIKAILIYLCDKMGKFCFEMSTLKKKKAAVFIMQNENFVVDIHFGSSLCLDVLLCTTRSSWVQDMVLLFWLLAGSQ